MSYTETRAKELRERFGVHNGQFWGYYRFKNLNWYLFSDSGEEGEWFCYGDIRDEDIPRLQGLLNLGETLVLGWKELPPDQMSDPFFGEGAGTWLIFSSDEVIYDIRRDHGRKCDCNERRGKHSLTCAILKQDTRK